MWTLTPHSVIEYSIRAGLLPRSAVVDGGLRVTVHVHRNQIIQVSHLDGSGFILKQPTNAESRATVVREAEFYDTAWSHDILSSLRPWIPRLIQYDRCLTILALTLQANTTSLHRSMLGWESFHPQIFEIIGEAYRTIHRIPTEAESALGVVSAPPPPWILRLLHVTEPHISPPHEHGVAASQVIAAARANTGICEGLRPLSGRLHSARLIHGDARWSNILLTEPELYTSSPTLKLIDWEAVTRGDPALDTGGIVHGFFVNSLLTLADSSDNDDVVVDRAIEMLLGNRHGLRAFWKGYSNGTDDACAVVELDACIRASAAKLIQTGYEMAIRDGFSPLVRRMLIASERLIKSVDLFVVIIKQDTA